MSKTATIVCTKCGHDVVYKHIATVTSCFEILPDGSIAWSESAQHRTESVQSGVFCTSCNRFIEDETGTFEHEDVPHLLTIGLLDID